MHGTPGNFSSAFSERTCCRCVLQHFRMSARSMLGPSFIQAFDPNLLLWMQDVTGEAQQQLDTLRLFLRTVAGSAAVVLAGESAGRGSAAFLRFLSVPYTFHGPKFGPGARHALLACRGLAALGALKRSRCDSKAFHWPHWLGLFSKGPSFKKPSLQLRCSSGCRHPQPRRFHHLS